MNSMEQTARIIRSKPQDNGAVATGEKTIADVGTEIFELILDVASGARQPYSD